MSRKRSGSAKEEAREDGARLERQYGYVSDLPCLFFFCFECTMKVRFPEAACFLGEIGEKPYCIVCLITSSANFPLRCTS